MSDDMKEPSAPRKASRTHDSRKHKSEEEGSSTIYYLMIGMVALLLLFSIVQTVQVNALKERVQAGGVASVAAPAAQAPAPQAPAPRAAPAMVGGC